ncbi:pneumococcal-type histidine triad protein [Streptococcus gallinaceus]|uniref:Histidine triad protein (Predicted protease) n=1 Tax=Streptococcus gallinaceus TaxID=165758 RepID=A0ABV2JJP2_9STRE
MKKKQLLYSGLILAALASGSALAYQLGVSNGKSSTKPSVQYVKNSSKDADKSETMASDASKKDAKEEGIAAEQIVVKITDEGYVTSHGDHFHYYSGKVPYDAIISEELLMKDPNYVLDQSHVVSSIKNGYVIKVDGKYYVYLEPNKPHDQVRSKEQIAQQRKGNYGHQAGANQTNTERVKNGGSYKTDDGYVFHPSDVMDDLGDAYIVRHGDHMHYVPKSDLSESERVATKQFWTQHKPALTAVAPARHSQGSSATVTPVDKVQAVPSAPAVPNADESLAAKRAYMAKMYNLPLSVIQIAGDYFTYPHGNHRHAMLISKVVVGQFPTAESVAADLNHGHEPMVKPAEPATPVQPSQPSTPTPAPSQSKEEPTETKPVLDKELKAKIDYISQLYGVDPATVQVQGDSLIWPHENHSHSIKIADVVIPKMSDDPEADFEAELNTLAKSMHVDSSSIIIADGTMTISHVDHTHTYNIKSPGWRDYIKNKVPIPSGAYIPGTLDRKVVNDKVTSLIQLAEEVYKDKPKQVRRIKSALNSFQQDLVWATNSTAGYLKILSDFENKYIQASTAPTPSEQPIATPSDKEVTWKELDFLSNKISAALTKDHPEFTQANFKLRDLNVTISFRQGDKAALKAKLLQFAADYHLPIDAEAPKPGTATTPSDKPATWPEVDALSKAVSAVLTKEHPQFSDAKRKLHSLSTTIAYRQGKPAALEEQLNQFMATYNLKVASASADSKPAENAETTKPNGRQLANLKQYLTANQFDKRLTAEVRKAVQVVLWNGASSVQELENLKQQVKDCFRQYEEKQSQLSARIADSLAKSQDLLSVVGDAERKAAFQATLDDFKAQLQASDTDKTALYAKAKELQAQLEQEKAIAEAPVVPAEASQSAPSVNEDSAALAHQAEVKKQIQEIVDFINQNKDKIETKPASLKQDLLNQFVAFQAQLANGSANVDELLGQFQALKAQIEPHIKANTGYRFNPSDWSGMY